jgi:hypothetical protein
MNDDDRSASMPYSHIDGEHGLEKVVFDLEETWHGHATESLWAKPTEEGFVLRNIPFFAYGVSYDDVVAVAPLKEGFWRSRSVVRHAGHSTYRIFVQQDAEFPHGWNQLAGLGCTYEQATPHLYAIDVPATANIDGVYQVLEREKSRGIWDFEEGYFGHGRRGRKWFGFR